MARPGGISGHGLVQGPAGKGQEMAYDVIGMLRVGGLQKDLNGYVYGDRTLYLNAQERAQYEVDAHAGKLRFNKSLAFVDTADGNSKVYLFIMTGEGAIFMASQNTVNHHSAFVSGNPVAAAGTIKVELGLITLITSESGHYQPPKEFLDQFMDELKKRNADLSRAELTFGATKATNKQNRLRKFGKTKIADVTTLTLPSTNKVLLDKGSHYEGQLLRIYPEGVQWKWY